MPILYGDPISGNCLKVKWVAAHLRIPLDWRDVDVTKGETRNADFLAMNPSGQVPVLVLDDARVLAQSNAIITYLAHGSALIPGEPFAHAQMLQWMFWEQYSHEPYIAVRRFRMRYLGEAAEKLDPKLFERGSAALQQMEAHLGERDFFLGAEPSLADIALVAYTRMAGEGGFDLAAYPAVRAWIGLVEAAFDIAD